MMILSLIDFKYGQRVQRITRYTFVSYQSQVDFLPLPVTTPVSSEVPLETLPSPLPIGTDVAARVEWRVAVHVRRTHHYSTSASRRNRASIY